MIRAVARGPAGNSSIRQRAYRGYRPLQARTLLPQLLVLAAAETVVFASYAAVDARAHWSAHLLVGLVAALVWLSAYLLHAVARLLGRHRLGPVAVVGHSWGAAVAVALARRHPDRAEQLLLITPPAFADPSLARHRLGARSWIDRRTVAGKPVSQVACGTMCLSRRALGRLAVLTHPGVAPEVARGTVAHTYPAFRDGLDALHPAPGVDIAQIPGDHHLPISAPQPVAEFLLARLSRWSDQLW